MSIKKEIEINNGRQGGKQKFYYWSEYESYEEAVYYAKKIKDERKGEMKIKYFIVETKESWFLPVAKFVLYFNKKMRLI